MPTEAARNNTGEPHNKRRAGEETCNNPDQPLLRGDLEGMLAEAARQAAVACEEAFAEACAKQTANFTNLVRQYDVQMSARVGQVEGDVKDLKTAQAATDDKQAELWTKVQALERALAMAEADAHAVLNGTLDTSFDRVPDATILRINSATPVLKEPLQLFLDKWLVDLNLKQEDATLTSGKPDSEACKYWKVQLNGLPRTAAGRVSNLLHSLREENGDWKPTAVQSGGTAVRLFISADKSAKQITTEIHTKAAKKAMEQLHPTLSWRVQTKEGTLLVDQVPVIRIVADKRKQSHPEFNESAMQNLGINREAAKARIKEVTNDTGGSSGAAVCHWSI